MVRKIIKQIRNTELISIFYFLIFGIVFILSIYLRIHNIDKYFSFGFDGEQAIELFRSQQIIKDLFALNLSSDFWIGPTATNNLNIGHLYHGALIHWILIPIGIFTNFDPKMAVWLFVLLGILAVFLIYLITKRIAGNTAALIALLLSGVSFLLVNYSRTQWNPSLVPFLSSLSIYLYLRISDKKNKLERYKIMFFVAIFFLSQAHISSYITSFILLFLVFINRKKILKTKISNIIFYVTSLLLFFLILLMLGQSNFVIVQQLFKSDNASVNIINLFSFQKNILGLNEYFGFIPFPQYPYKETFAYLLSLFISMEALMFLLRGKLKIRYKSIFLHREILIFLPIILLTQLLLVIYLGNTDNDMFVSNNIAQFVPIVYVLIAALIGYLLKNVFLRVITLTIFFLLILVNFEHINIHIASSATYGLTYADKVELVNYLKSDLDKSYKYEVFYEIEDLAGKDELLFLIRQKGLDLPQKYNNKIDLGVVTLDNQTPQVIYLFHNKYSSPDGKISDDFLKSNNITQFKKQNLGKFWIYKIQNK